MSTWHIYEQMVPDAPWIETYTARSNEELLTVIAEAQLFRTEVGAEILAMQNGDMRIYARDHLWNGSPAWLVERRADRDLTETMTHALRRALPLLMLLGDYIGNGPVDVTNPRSLGVRVDVIAEINDVLRAYEARKNT